MNIWQDTSDWEDNDYIIYLGQSTYIEEDETDNKGSEESSD